MLPIVHISQTFIKSTYHKSYLLTLDNFCGIINLRKGVMKMQTKEILKNLRKENNYSAQQVADGCSMSLGVYKKYESGERGVGTPALCKFADFYGVTTDYLLGREQSKQEEIGNKMTVKEMEDDIVDRWLKLGEIGREIVYNMLRSMVDLAEIKKQEEEKSKPIKQVAETIQQAQKPQITQAKPQISQQPVRPPIIQQFNSPSPQNPVEQPVLTQQPPQPQPGRMAARSTNGRYVTRYLTPEEVENLRSLDEEPEF